MTGIKHSPEFLLVKLKHKGLLQENFGMASFFDKTSKTMISYGKIKKIIVNIY